MHICVVGCQTTENAWINEANAVDDFESGDYRIFKYGFFAFEETVEENYLNGEYGINFVTAAGDVIPLGLDLGKVNKYNDKMIALLNEKYEIDIKGVLNGDAYRTSR